MLDTSLVATLAHWSARKWRSKASRNVSTSKENQTSIYNSPHLCSGPIRGQSQRPRGKCLLNGGGVAIGRSMDDVLSRRPMRRKPGDKIQVPQQYGCQYKCDACKMGLSPRYLTTANVVLCYARRNVTFLPPDTVGISDASWLRPEIVSSERFYEKPGRDSAVSSSGNDSACFMSILRLNRRAAISLARLASDRIVGPRSQHVVLPVYRRDPLLWRNCATRSEMQGQTV